MFVLGILPSGEQLITFFIDKHNVMFMCVSILLNFPSFFNFYHHQSWHWALIVVWYGVLQENATPIPWRKFVVLLSNNSVLLDNCCVWSHANVALDYFTQEFMNCHSNKDDLENLTLNLNRYCKWTLSNCWSKISQCSFILLYIFSINMTVIL